MQYQPGTWYLPWGIPLQKMLAMQFSQTAPSPTVIAGGPAAYLAPNAAPLTCQVLTPQQQQHHQQQQQHHQQQQRHHQHQHHTTGPVGATTIQVTPGHGYQHSVGSYPCANAGITLHQIGASPTQATNASLTNSLSVLNGHNTHPLVPPTHHHTLQNTTHAQHPNALISSTTVVNAANAAAAAVAASSIFTPLSLQTYLTATGNCNSNVITNRLNSLSENPGPPHTHTLTNNCDAATAAAAAAHLMPQQANQANSNAAQLNVLASPNAPHATLMPTAINLNVDVVAMRHHIKNANAVINNISTPLKKLLPPAINKDAIKLQNPEKRKADDFDQLKDLKKAKLETKALKAKRPGFTDERYHETSYYIENGLRKVYPYYFTFTTFTKGRWVGEKILDVFAREFRAHPAEEYERCIKSGTLTVNYEKVPIDYRLKHNDLLANIVHRHEVPVTSQPITIVFMDDDIVVVNKPASIPVHPCGRYRHNTVVFILAKEYNLKNLRTIHRLDRLTSGLLLFGRSPKKARQMEHQIRNRQVQKEYICRVEGNFPEGIIECTEPIEVVSYKIGVCKVSLKGKDCRTTFQKISQNGRTSVVLCKPLTGRMHQIRVHLQYLGYPVVNDPLYNHEVFGPLKGRGGDIGGKTDEELVSDLINIHNAENWLGIDGDSDISLFKTIKDTCDVDNLNFSIAPKANHLSDNDSQTSRETSPTCADSPVIADTTSTTKTLNSSSSNNNNSTSGNILQENEQHLNLCTNIMNVNTITANATTTTTTTTDTIAITKSYNYVIHNNADNKQNANNHVKVTVATQTGHESPDMAYNAEKMTYDKHCYECKVRYRDPKPKDLVMYLHAWKYKGPGWEYETELPDWAKADWLEIDQD